MTTLTTPVHTNGPAQRTQIRAIGRRMSLTGAVGPLSVLLLMVVIYFSIRPSVLNADGINTIFNASVPLAIAAGGACIVTIVGGFDFSAGAALSLVNVVIATRIGDSLASQVTITVLGLLVGVAVGLINGLLVTILEIPSIVATLAASFLWGGIALLLLSQPGGMVPVDYSLWWTGSIGGAIPMTMIVLAAVVLAWIVLKRTRLGRAIYAVGGDLNAATLNGVSVDRTVLLAYALGGLLYGVAGVLLTAVTSSGDPAIGTPLLLPIFAAVAIGGVRFGGGRGDLLGAAAGAFILYTISDLLYAFGVSSFYTSILNGVLLIVAVALTTLAARGSLRLPALGRHNQSHEGSDS